MVCYAACSHSLSLFCFSSLYAFRMSLLIWLHEFLFIQVIFKHEKNNKVAYSRCRKRSILSTTSIDQHLQHIKLNPGVQTGLGSKLLQHSSFPSKPLVTTFVCGAAKTQSSFSLLKNHSLLSWLPLRHNPHLKKPQAYIVREDMLCMSLTFK